MFSFPFLDWQRKKDAMCVCVCMFVCVCVCVCMVWCVCVCVCVWCVGVWLSVWYIGGIGSWAAGLGGGSGADTEANALLSRSASSAYVSIRQHTSAYVSGADTEANALVCRSASSLSRSLCMH